MNSNDIKRLHYYEQQYLRTSDFVDEQRYHVLARRRHHVANHRYGIVTGLEVTADTDSGEAAIQPGMAIDGFGREIVVFDAVPLDKEKLASQKPDTSVNAKVYICYREEVSDRPGAGYDVCGQTDQHTRRHETYILPYMEKPPGYDRTKPLQPFENIDDNLGAEPWPVYLATVTLEADSTQPSGWKVASVEQEDRKYIDVLAEMLYAPDGSLTIKNLKAVEENGDSLKVEVHVEGSVDIDEDLFVESRLGVGTDTPDTVAQVADGSPAELSSGTGWIVIGKVDSNNLVFDDRQLMARNNEAAAPLKLQSEGGDLSIHASQEDSSLIINDEGKVGIGTLTPDCKLHVSGDTNATFDSGSGLLQLGLHCISRPKAGT
jgi:hypothetical protein